MWKSLFLFLVVALVLLVNANEQPEEQQQLQSEQNVDAVPELDIDNLETIIQSRNWTCVLFYDPLDETNNADLLWVMDELNLLLKENNRIGFARLDIRRHPHYRQLYKYANDPNPFLQDFYTEFPDDATDALKISSRTFMHLQDGDLYWPSRIVLFAYDFNVYGEIDLDFNSNAQAKVGILQRWLEMTVPKDPQNMQVLMWSQTNKERLRAKRNAKYADNSFTFNRYFAKHPPHLSQEASGESSTDRFLLESGTDHNNGAEGGFWTYDTMGINSRDVDSEGMLTLLANVIDKYLIWCEGYETLWTVERKARENEQSNFGPLLEELNTQVRTLIDTIFDNPNYAPPNRTFDQELGDTEEERQESLQRRHQVPNLKPYFDEMIFGYGRSPASLRHYLEQEVKAKLGDTPEERRANRKKGDLDAAIFQRMREYMQVVEDVTRDDDLYLNPLADLVSQWHNLLVEFHTKVSQAYVDYLAKNPLPDHSFPRKSMDVLDMQDPNNFDFLSDYNAFHEKYTKPAIPVVLGNVNMTNERYTLEYLKEQCGSMDVTHTIRWSNPVGQKSTEAWGGLKGFVLPNELIASDSSRRQRKRGADSDDDSDDDVDSDDSSDDDSTSLTVDRSITLEQFIILSQEIGNVYLHDHTLPDECDTILHEGTLYDKHQKFRIPSVVAAYDLFHRVTLYSYSRSWPSLFVGKKGTNSKVHVDSGASGFFMYLVEGRKRWIVTHPSERPFLYDRIHTQAFVPDVLGFDKSDAANEFLGQRFPLLHRAENVYEIIQEPGQLIYIPPDSPHAVENLDDIIGVALNLVPRDAFANHLHDQIHLDRKFGFTELALKYWLFEDNAEAPHPTEDPLYATFAEYKAQY